VGAIYIQVRLIVQQLQYMKIYGKTWKWLSSNEQQPIWQSLNNFFNNKNGQMVYNPGVESS
jgi:hypothetical protein